MDGVVIDWDRWRKWTDGGRGQMVEEDRWWKRTDDKQWLAMSNGSIIY